MTDATNPSYRYEVETEEELQRLKDKCVRCRVILLDRKGLDPLSNLSTLTKRQKDLFLQELDAMMRETPEEEIIREFNSIVCDDLLDPKKDITKYGVVNKSEVDLSAMYNSETP